MDELITIDCGITPRGLAMWFHMLLQNLSIPSLLPAMSSQQMMAQSYSSYQGPWKFKAMPDNVVDS